MTVQNKRYFGLAAAVVLGVTTVAIAGLAPIATFSGDAVVTVNGKPITQSQPAFAGDTIEAPGSSLAVIHFPEQGMASLSAAARASVEQSGKQLWVGLQRGFVGVHEGGQAISVRAHGGKITADSGSVFQVAQVKDATYVTVVKGSAVLSEGGLDEPQVVQQGQSYKVAFLEPGPALPMAGGSGAPQATGGKDTTCSDMKANCSKDASTCKAYAARCNVCNNPCKSGSSQACTDFKALEAKCTPMRKACAKDQTKCAEYGTSCQALAGCKGYGGVLEMSSGAAAGGAAASGAAAAASAGAAAGAASATAVTAAVAAASAGAAVAGAAASGSFSNNSTPCVSPNVPTGCTP